MKEGRKDGRRKVRVVEQISFNLWNAAVCIYPEGRTGGGREGGEGGREGKGEKEKEATPIYTWPGGKPNDTCRESSIHLRSFPHTCAQ